ncbi:MAG: hypothetical protein EXR50_03435 [Dehalococcoidia bacterium]|nr:hypothetical protein [Dehalococcoidia bacterium]
MTTKEQLHRIIEELPDGELEAAERALTDPFVLALLNTPEGEEPLTAEEIAGIMEGKRDQAAGRIQRFSDVGTLINKLHDEAEH